MSAAHDITGVPGDPPRDGFAQVVPGLVGASSGISSQTQAGVAQAAPASFSEDPTGWMWTPERNALLRKLVADGVPRSKCIAPLNTLPGKPFTKFQQIAAQMNRLGIRLSREHYGAATRTAAINGAAARAAQLQRLTPDRMAYMREAYPAGVSVAEMLAALNALPGPPIASIKAVRHHLGKAGLSRPVPARDEAQQRSVEARRAREARYRARVRAAQGEGRACRHRPSAWHHAIDRQAPSLWRDRSDPRAHRRSHPPGREGSGGAARTQRAGRAHLTHRGRQPG